MMTADEIRAGVQALEPWFHQIDLGHGIMTKLRSAATEPLDHPAGTWEIIKRCLPEDLEGRSVLDVGCNGGFYALEAKRRNAGRVLGIDSQRLPIRQARFAARVLGLDIEYERMSVYDVSLQRTGKFDITLALGLIYHCKHPLLALERLFQVTSDLLIVESEVLVPTVSPPALRPGHRDRTAAASAGLCRERSGFAGSGLPEDWFVPSVDSLQAMLRDTGFIDADLVSEARGRAVLVCRRPYLRPDSLSMPQLLAAELTLVEGPMKCRCDAPATFRISAKNTGAQHMAGARRV